MSNLTVSGRSVLPLSIVVGILVSALFGLWVLLPSERDAGTAASDGESVILAQDAEDGDPDAEGSAGLEAAALPVTYDTFLSRDPFETIRPPEPVATDPANGDPSTSDPSTTDPTGTDPTNGDPSSDDPTKDTPVQGDGVCRTGTEAVCDGNVIVLKSVTGGAALLEVNAVEYNVAPGANFAGNLRLLSIDGQCADLLYQQGDEADVFQLCVGARASK